jgi:hypothetical protein
MDNQPNNKPKQQGQTPVQSQPEVQQVVIEREINLALLNDKLNIILNILAQLQPEPKK